MKNLILTSTLFLLGLSAYGQQYTPEQYIERFHEIAVSEMYRTGVPASIKLAQGFLESGFGNSELAQQANNLFGIKGVFDWDGEYYEYKGSTFRKYDNADQSFKDHSDYLLSREMYKFIFEYDKTDYEKWAWGLQKAGYGSKKTYAEHLIDIITRYNFSKYDTYPNPNVSNTESNQ